jgi:phosphatidylglycerophosphatase A
MPDYDELIHTTAAIEKRRLAEEKIEKKGVRDYFSLAVTTFGVGYIPLAPGTFGSAVGVLIYLLFDGMETGAMSFFSTGGWTNAQIYAWLHVVNLILFLLFCLLGVWASGRATRLFKDKDPQRVVVDEVMGQLLTFLFIPFGAPWFFVVAGFLLFRLFDIWKPYPIDSLQNLPAGIGVCADDLLAGVYGGVCLATLYAIGLSF